MKKIYCICVDDQREVLGSVARDLAVFSEWVTVEECESAEEAKRLLDELAAKGEKIALIVCDHIMPGANGVDFLADLVHSRKFPHMKKILLTGQATHKDTIEAINRARVDYYLEKPWRPEQLQAACRALLTEYLFDSGLYTHDMQTFVDPKVLVYRMAHQAE